MSFLRVLLLAFFALAAACPAVCRADPEVKLNWATPRNDQINVSVEGDDLRNECLKSGFEVRYRFEFELCKGRTFWWDSCGDMRTLTHAIVYDPIGDSYKVTSDLFGDDVEPNIWQGSQQEQAVQLFSKVAAFPISFVSKKKLPRHAYLSVRVYSECKGEYSKWMSKLSYFLSLGLIRISGFDTGRVRFNLKP